MNEVEVESQVGLEKLFPVDELKENKSLINKFIKEIKQRQQDNLIPLYNLRDKEFYCNPLKLLKQPSPINYHNDNVLVLTKDIKDKKIGFVFKEKESLLSTDGYHDPLHFYSIITPQIAHNLLIYHNYDNRNINLNRVQMYARCMADGEWQSISQGISFCEDGSLNNGQHRLYAIIFSGVSVRIGIASGEPKLAKLYIDEGKTRTDKDAAIMMGSDYNAKITPVIKYILEFKSQINKEGGGSYRKERLDFYNNYCKEGVDFVFSKINEITIANSNKDGVLNLALLKAGLVRLYYNIDRYKEDNKYLKGGALERFNQLLYVIITGTAYSNRSEDNAAIYIHNQRTSKQNRKRFEGNNRRSGYFIAEKCFDAFMKKNEMKKFRKDTHPKEMFLLPMEKKEIERKKNIYE